MGEGEGVCRRVYVMPKIWNEMTDTCRWNNNLGVAQTEKEED